MQYSPKDEIESHNDKAIEIVQAFLEGGYDTEAQDEQMLNGLRQILPDPEFERFLFWGPEGPQESGYETMTAEEIVDTAFAYHPIEL
jgi:hypothetical protein